MPGWFQSSWGYHGNDGKLYSDGKSRTYGDTFGTGDVMGCQISNEGVTFTKNGTSLGKRSPDFLI